MSGPEGARLQRLLKKSKQQIPRGLKPARSDKIKILTAHLKVRPFKKSAETDSFSNLFSRADRSAQKNWPLGPWRIVPQRLKPGSLVDSTARLKACPFKAALHRRFFGRAASTSYIPL